MISTLFLRNHDFKGLFGGEKGDSPQSVRFSNAINSDVAVRSSSSIPSLFTSSGLESGLYSGFAGGINNTYQGLKQHFSAEGFAGRAQGIYDYYTGGSFEKLTMIYNFASSTVGGVADMAGGVYDFALNAPSMNEYDQGYGIGYGVEKLAEILIVSRGAGLAGNAIGGVTTTGGFLFRGFTVKTPINIPVQRFGNLSIRRPDFWRAKIGTSRFANRTFGAIKPAWNPLSQYSTGVIPKGTQIKFGIIGPQGLRYPGGSFQFIVPSRSAINQSSKNYL